MGDTDEFGPGRARRFRTRALLYTICNVAHVEMVHLVPVLGSPLCQKLHVRALVTFLITVPQQAGDSKTMHTAEAGPAN